MAGRASQVLLLMLAAACLAGCGRVKQSTPAPPHETWTPEQIAANPVGYLQYADRRIGEQIRGREERLAELGQRRADVAKRAGELETKMKDAANIATRLAAAVQRAVDEDAWPVKFAGRTFDKAKAESIVASMNGYREDYQPLAQAYGEALRKLESTEGVLRKDIEDLGRMRQKVNIDMERVRLNEGMTEIADLRKTEADLAGFSQTLADITRDETSVDLQELQRPRNVPDVESLLK